MFIGYSMEMDESCYNHASSWWLTPWCYQQITHNVPNNCVCSYPFKPQWRTACSSWEESFVSVCLHVSVLHTRACDVSFRQGGPLSSAGIRGCNLQHSWAAAFPPLCGKSLAFSSRSGLLSAGLVNRLKFVEGDYVCHGKWVRQWARFYGLVSPR